MVAEDYVSYEIAKLLKEKGFDWECFQYWYEEGNKLIHSQSIYPIQNISNPSFFGPAAPTLQSARKWLKEKYNILLVVDYEYECDTTPYFFKIYRLGKYGKPERVAIKGVSYDKDNNATEHIVGYRDWERSKGDYSTYERAANAAIKYCLENLI